MRTPHQQVAPSKFLSAAKRNMKTCFGVSGGVNGLRQRLEQGRQQMISEGKRRFSFSSSNNKENAYSAKADLEQSYTLTKEVLGKGNYGKVWLATCINSGDQVAVKIINKRRVNKAALPRLQREASVMRRIDHKSIVRMLCDYEDDKEIILVLEYCQGHELFQELAAHGRFTRRRTRRLLQSLLEAVDYLHSQGIAHRDIKLENIMCTADINHMDESEDEIKLIDFGLARSMLAADDPDAGVGIRISDAEGLKRMDSKVGTIHYTAPQVLDPNTSYGKACDLWSVGVIGYILLTGAPPFQGKTAAQVAQSVKEGKINFADRALVSNGTDAVDLLRSLLCAEESGRLTANEALQHQFFTETRNSSAVQLSDDVAEPPPAPSVDEQLESAATHNVLHEQSAVMATKDKEVGEITNEWILVSSPLDSSRKIVDPDLPRAPSPLPVTTSLEVDTVVR